MSQVCNSPDPQKHRRMLGRIELVVHGSSRKPEMTRAIMNAIASSGKLTGRLLIGYPIPTDAVLVSDQGQVTVILLDNDGPIGQEEEKQDRAFIAVDRLLKLDPALWDGRKPRVAVQTITVRSGIGPVNPSDPEHPVVNITAARHHLETFQENPPQDVDPDRVIKQLLWLPPVT